MITSNPNSRVWWKELAMAGFALGLCLLLVLLAWLYWKFQHFVDSVHAIWLVGGLALFLIVVAGVLLLLERRHCLRLSDTLHAQQATLEDRVEHRTFELARRNEELRRSENRYRSLANATTQIVWTADERGALADTQAWARFTNIAPERLRGVGWLEAVHAEDRESVRTCWDAAVSAAAPFDCHCRIRRADGVWRDVQARGVPLRDESGQVREWVGVCTDITEQKQAQAAIREINLYLERRIAERTAQLEAANKELEAFSYSISHDLRAPLRAMNGFARILQEEYAALLPAEAQRYLTRVQSNAQQMGCLVDELLGFSRLARQPLTKRPVNMVSLVEQVLTELKLDCEGRRVETTVGDLPPCQGEPAMLRQALLNLIGNAVKFTRQRDPARIEIGCQRSGDAAPVYYVKDNGVGFDMRYVGKLFGVFQRLHRPEDFPGTGVGLAIVQRIVQRHGGRIWAEAEPDQGAAFYFTLEETP